MIPQTLGPWTLGPWTLGMSASRTIYPFRAPCGAAIKYPDAAMGALRSRSA